MRVGRVKHWAVVGVWFLPTLLAAFYTAATLNSGGGVWPWAPGMADFGVYVRTGQLVVAGGDIFHTQDLPWVYPPFAALLAVPISLPPITLSAALWTLGCVVALVAVLYRMGLSGWKLSLASFVCVLAVTPVHETIGFGQLGIFLVAAAILDSMPGPRVFKRRLFPEGVLVGLAAAVKLTPAAIAAQSFFAGRRKPGLVAFAAFAGATMIGFAVLPSASAYYWWGLIQGNTGINSGIVYGTNQSLMAALARATHGANAAELGVAALVAVAGIVVSVWVEKAGNKRLAICLAGLTSLLASPISWSHHFVWVVPLGLVLWQEAKLPAWYRWLGFGYIAWMIAAWYEAVPRGADIELTYSWTEQILTNIGPVYGLLFLLSGFLLVRGSKGTVPLAPLS